MRFQWPSYFTEMATLCCHGHFSPVKNPSCQQIIFSWNYFLSLNSQVISLFFLLWQPTGQICSIMVHMPNIYIPFRVALYSACSELRIISVWFFLNKLRSSQRWTIQKEWIMYTSLIWKTQATQVYIFLCYDKLHQQIISLFSLTIAKKSQLR